MTAVIAKVGNKLNQQSTSKLFSFAPTAMTLQMFIYPMNTGMPF